jgi:sec-independent protein translocase protein TatA
MMISDAMIQVAQYTQQLAFLGFGGIGNQELLVIGIIALLLFGKRLPEVARNLGKGFSEFKRGVSGFQDEVRKASTEVERKTVDYTPKDTQASRPAAKVRAATSDSSDDDFTAPKFDVD